MQCKCEVSGCSRVTWNGKKGEQCCRTCKLTGGARHDDGCTPSLCTRPVYRSLTSLVARHDYTPMERSAGMTKLQARVWRLVDRSEPIISRFSLRLKRASQLSSRLKITGGTGSRPSIVVYFSRATGKTEDNIMPSICII